MQLLMVFSFLIMTGATQCYGSTLELEQDPHTGQAHNYIQHVLERIRSSQEYELRLSPSSKSKKAAPRLMRDVKEHSNLSPFTEPIPKAALKQQHIFDLFNDGSVMCPHPDGIFPVEKDCSSFITCVNYVPQVNFCNEGYCFNTLTNKCELPKFADRKRQCPHPDGIFPVEEDCSSFIRCVNNVPQVHFCNKGYCFNTLTNKCELPKLADRKHQCPQPDGIFPVEEDCSSFIRCVNNVPQVHFCNKGYCFNTLTNKCELPKLADRKHQCPHPDGIFPVEEDCSSFIRCVNNVPQVHFCNKGYCFDTLTNKCELPKLADRKHQCPHPDGIFPVEEDCSSFIRCVNNVPQVHFCNKGYCFDTLTNKCELPKLADRKHQCPSPNGRFAVPGNRPELFIECVDNNMSVKVCPSKLRYNTITKNCSCEDRIKKSWSKNKNKEKRSEYLQQL